MNNSANSYEHLARVYMRYLRPYSPLAVKQLESIHGRFGARAAFVAALMLTDLKQKMDRIGQQPDVIEIEPFANEFPQARSEFELTLETFLKRENPASVSPEIQR